MRVRVEMTGSYFELRPNNNNKFRIKIRDRQPQLNRVTCYFGQSKPIDSSTAPPPHSRRWCFYLLFSAGGRINLSLGSINNSPSRIPGHIVVNWWTSRWFVTELNSARRAARLGVEWSGGRFKRLVPPEHIQVEAVRVCRVSLIVFEMQITGETQ